MRDIASWVALVLAAGVSVGFAGTVLLLAIAPEPAATASIQLLGPLGGAVVGALAAFLGARSAVSAAPPRSDLDQTQYWPVPPPIPERPERPAH